MVTIKRFAALLLYILLLQTAYAQTHSAGLQLAQQMQQTQAQTVLLNNQAGLLPLQSLDKLNIAHVSFKDDNAAAFDSIAAKYLAITYFNADTVLSATDFNQLHDRLKLYNTVLITLMAKVNFTPALKEFLADLENNTTVIISLTGDGKNLNWLNGLKSPVIWSKNSGYVAASISAQAIFGGVALTAKLDANYTSQFRKGAGFPTQKTRLGYSAPEAVNVNTDMLKRVDSLVTAGIAKHSAPAVVILMAKDGQVIYNKAFGNPTYTAKERTRITDIFDMASVTKVTATVPTIMQLYDQNKLSLNDRVSEYVAATRNIPDKSEQTIKEALLHEAGYFPYIKFFERLKPGDMSKDSSVAYPTPVADGYYLRANYFNEVMWPVTLKSKTETRGKFVYSDISMYMMKEVTEEVTHQKLNDYVFNNFYKPLGMQRTGFLPRNRFPRNQIIPTTENDNWFRNMQVQGYVNDPGAAMAGGVEGHAGLFSTANDLGIFYQMLLNKGTYGGRQYYKPETIAMFTSRQSTVSHRALGYDRPTEKQLQEQPYVSPQAFWHSGYTGTYVWVDPKYNLVYICLTNRVYPDDNKTYGPPTVNIRAGALDLFYKAILAGSK